ncbi:unnamed protein product [Larinioides sclopetarius]|uniref:Maturase K n=1 Tax=Larinioides sclopetarius TaxID=280406 RepID=A0AAV1ZSB3_9ARAC
MTIASFINKISFDHLENRKQIYKYLENQFY